VHELQHSPRSVVKPGVTCRGMGKMSCVCFRLRHTSWYFVYETTAELCLDQRRHPGVISSSLCSTTEYCNITAAMIYWRWNIYCRSPSLPLQADFSFCLHLLPMPLVPTSADLRSKSLWHAMFKSTHCTKFGILV
jgi:hypothetical protein